MIDYTLYITLNGIFGIYNRNPRQIRFIMYMGEYIYALGGIMSDGSATSTIEFFNTTSLSWHRHNATLTFEDTTKLVVTPFPTSSIDCVTDCQCGIASAKQRIFNGTEAQVRFFYAILLGKCLSIAFALFVSGKCLPMDCGAPSR